MATTKLLTVEEFDLLEDDRLLELVDGELVEKMASGGESSRIGVRMTIRLGNHVEPGDLGAIFGADGGFLLRRNPDRIRVPDVAFVAAERLPPRAERQGTIRVVPDLAVEVLSPSDRLREARAKVREYLAAGVRLVWLVDPRKETVTVFGADGSEETLGVGQTLEGGEVLPGFRLALADLFR